MRAPCVPRIIFSNFCMFVAMQVNKDDEITKKEKKKKKKNKKKKKKKKKKNIKNDEVCEEPTNLQWIHNVTVATCQND